MKREQEIRSVKIPLLTQRHAFGCAMFFTMRQAIGGIRSLRREGNPAIPSDEGLQNDQILKRVGLVGGAMSAPSARFARPSPGTTRGERRRRPPPPPPP